jgi:hypothetical protein
MDESNGHEDCDLSHEPVIWLAWQLSD